MSLCTQLLVLARDRELMTADVGLSPDYLMNSGLLREVLHRANLILSELFRDRTNRQ